MAAGVDDLTSAGSGSQEVLRRLGGSDDLVDAYLASTLGLLAAVTAGYAIQAVLRVRAEETSLRAEPVLATRSAAGGGPRRTCWSRPPARRR